METPRLGWWTDSDTRRRYSGNWRLGVERTFYTVPMVLTERPHAVDRSVQHSRQTSLFECAAFRCQPISAKPTRLDDTSSILFQPGWLEGSGPVFDQLRDEMPWRAMERPMYDRIVDVPRLICTVRPSELDTSHPLRTITEKLEEAFLSKFFSVGLNFYRDGSDSVAWHRDTIRRRHRPTMVALVSLGSPRTLAIRPHAQHPSKTAETTGSTAATARKWRLGHGDLLVMGGACQRDWEHCVPKERSAGPRISLAFRCQEAPEGPRLGRTGVPPLWASHKLQ